MNELSSDILLQVFSYLPARDVSRSMSCCKRFLFVVECMEKHFGVAEVAASSQVYVRTETAGASLSSAPPPKRKKKSPSSSRINRYVSPVQVMEHALSKMHAKPNFCISFGSMRQKSSLNLSKWDGYVKGSLPPDIVVFHTQSHDPTQSAINGFIESESDFNCIMGHFPHSTVAPFVLQHDGLSEINSSISEIQSQLKLARVLSNSACTDTSADSTFWKIFIITIVGKAADIGGDVLRALQESYPDALIVGGVGDAGWVSVPKRLHQAQLRQWRDELRIRPLDELGTFFEEHRDDLSEESKEHLISVLLEVNSSTGRSPKKAVEDGIFGIAFGGADVPAKAVVSRGLRSMGSQLNKTWTIESGSIGMGGIIAIRRFDGEEGMGQHVETVVDEQSRNVVRLDESFLSTTEYIGVKRAGNNAFEICQWEQFDEGILVHTDIRIEKNAQIDFFILHGQEDDMERTMSCLRDQLVGKNLLGAVMFSCSGRGPMRNELIGTRMADATIFSEYFSSVPCVGFYASGEIGPKLLVGADDSNIFRKGSVALQGYTVVFLIFVVPVGKPENIQFDDSENHIERFVKSWMIEHATRTHDAVEQDSKISAL